MTTQLKSRCPSCQKVLKLGDEQVGKRVGCPRCKRPFTAKIEPDSSSGQEEQVAETVAGASSGTHPQAAAPTSAPEEVRSTGRLGRFVLHQLLGQGAFGRVYRAHDPLLDRFAALKVPSFDPNDKAKVQRFIIEAKAAARLHHPNIVPTYESGQIEGQYFIAAQFVAGQTLATRMKESRSDFRQAAEWLRQLADALAYAHNEGVIHRDIKPENIMLGPKDVPLIMDFGLAKRLNEDSAMTTDGSILGTPAYMAPEQARGEHSQVGPLADQYSLGVVFYELLTGKRAFEGPPHAVIAQVIGDETLDPQAICPEVPRDLAAICRKAMSKQPEARYASAAELSDDLNRWLGGESTIARPISAMERVKRWVARNPAIAGMLALIAVITFSGFAAVTGALLVARHETAEARRATQREANARETASSSQAEAERQTQIATTSAATAEAQRKNAVASEQRATKAMEGAQAAERKAQEISDRLEATLKQLGIDAEQITALKDQNVKLEAATVIDRAEQTEYRRHIVDADLAITAGDMVLARRALAPCLPRMRGWEWRYLASRAQQVKGTVLVTVAQNSTPRSLRYSRNGQALILGSPQRLPVVEGHPFAWNAVFPVANPKHIEPVEMPITTSSEGGPVCALSRDGNFALTLHNNPLSGKAVGQVWQWEAGTKEKIPDIPGFALDCGQTATGDWVVLTCKLDHDPTNHQYALKPPLELHNLTSRTTHPRRLITDSEFFAARLDDDASEVEVLTHERDEAQWQSVDFISGNPETVMVIPKMRYSPQWFGDARGELASWRIGGKRHMIFQRGDQCIVVHDGKLRPDLAEIVGHSTAIFDHAGSRLFVLRGDGEGLTVYDPRSPTPTTGLIHIYVEGATNPRTGWIGLEMSHDGSHLAVAIDEMVTLFDISHVPMAN